MKPIPFSSLPAQRNGSRRSALIIPIILLAFLLPNMAGDLGPLHGRNGEPQTISSVDMDPESPGYIYLNDFLWYYTLGEVDDPGWTHAGYDDKHWRPVPAEDGFEKIARSCQWPGVGCFRMVFKPGKGMAGRNISIHLRHLGVSALYVNGKRVQPPPPVWGETDAVEATDGQRQRLGVGDTDGVNHWYAASLNNDPVQVIAIRYSISSDCRVFHLGFPTGFSIVLNLTDGSIEAVTQGKMNSRVWQIILVLPPAILALLHLLLFIFYPGYKHNLLYSVCLFLFAVFFYFVMARFYAAETYFLILAYRLLPVLGSMALFFLLLTAYSIVNAGVPRKYAVFGILALIISFWGILRPMGVVYLGIYFYGVLVFTEMFRTFFRNGAWKRKDIRYLLFAVVLLLGISVYQAMYVIPDMIAQGLTALPRGFYMAYTYGGFIFLISMSLYLSYMMARMNRNLKEQLVQVRALSEKTLVQEREARQKELERRLLEADNRRKTKELEEARLLQLSMLPKDVPSHSGYDIAVFMKTATEVGGDYYDFIMSNDGSLTTVVGDATGHGMKAGTMVTAAKSLVGTYNQTWAPCDFLNKCSRVIHRMRLGNMFMAMLMVKLNGGRGVVASAGMPPALVFREEVRKVEKIISKSPPMGGFIDYDYRQLDLELVCGDVLLLMSDGLIERFDADGRMLGIESVVDRFEAAAHGTAAQIISQLDELGERWSGQSDPDDDITIVVIKKIK